MNQFKLRWPSTFFRTVQLKCLDVCEPSWTESIFQLVQIYLESTSWLLHQIIKHSDHAEYLLSPKLLWHKSNTSVNSICDLFSTFCMSVSRHKVVSFSLLWRSYLSCLFCIWNWIDLPEVTHLLKWQKWVMNRGLGKCKASDFCHH